MILPSDPLERVRSGMPVVDADGRSLGRVVRVQLAPPPVTHPPDSDIIDDMTNLVPAPPEMSEASAEFNVIGTSPVGHDPSGLPDLPEELRAHLEQAGFIEIEGAGLEEADRFVAADHIDEVKEDRVVIRAGRP